MSLREAPQSRYRERYAGKRIEDKAVFGGELTHPLERSGSTVKYEQLPLKSEGILDFGRFLNRLVVRELDGPILGQSLDREDILSAIDPQVWATAGKVVAPSTRYTWAGGKLPNYSPLYTQGGVGSVGQPLSPATSALSAFSLFSNPSTPYADVLGLSKNQLAQLMIRGTSTGSNVALAPSLPLGWLDANSSDTLIEDTDSRLGQADRLEYCAGVADALTAAGLSDAMYSTEGVHNELILDYIGLSMVHSSALSFLYQYHDALINISSQTQYLASELVGFYEKGLKGDFLRHYNTTEVQLMFALVELGAAVRRQVIVQNTSVNSNHVQGRLAFNGSFNPFWAHIKSTSAVNSSGAITSTVKHNRIYAPWWLSTLIDRYHFEYDDAVDDVRDIHREDLFQGIKLLLEAASLEYGMIVKNQGTPYLDFFENFETAVMREFNDWSDVKTLRTLSMVGYSRTEDYESMEEPTGLGMSFFRDFFSNNQIVQSARQDLERDYAEMDKIGVITGDMFKAGQQLLGGFEYTTNHRLTRFGSKTTDVKLQPMICWRPLSYKPAMVTSVLSGGEVVHSLAGADTSAAYQAVFNSTFNISLESDTSGLTALPHADTSDGAVATLETGMNATGTIIDWLAFPSIPLGLDSLAHGYVHPSADPATGYGHIRVPSANGSATVHGTKAGNDLFAGSSPLAKSDMYHVMQNVGRRFMVRDGAGAGDNVYIYNVQGNVPLMPKAYWMLGASSMLGGFVLRMNKIYTAWQGRTSGLFRRSELKNMLNFTSYSLTREMKMNTPDAHFAKYAEAVLGIMSCGGTGFSPALASRLVDRKLDDVLVHARSSSGIHGSGTDYTDADVLVTPWTMEANNVEEMFFTKNLLSFFTGLLGEDLNSLKLPGHHTLVGTDLALTHAGYLSQPTSGSTSLNSAGIASMGVTAFDVNSNTVLTENIGTVTTYGTSNPDAGVSLMLRRSAPGVRELDFFPVQRDMFLLPEYTGKTYKKNSAGDAWELADNETSVVATTLDNHLYLPRNRGYPYKARGLRTFYHYFKPLDGD